MKPNEIFRIFEHPHVTEQLCQEIADNHHESNVAVVIGPTTGGALLAQEVARQLQVRCMIVKPVSTGGIELRRNFTHLVQVIIGRVDI